MANVQTFLGAEYESLEKEEEYLKDILREIREFETELRTEEREVLFLEKIIRRLKGRIANFQQNVFPQIAVFLARLNQRDANRQYHPKFDEWILTFAEIEFDCSVVNHVIAEINNVFKRKMEEQMKEDMFYSHLIREHKENDGIMKDIRELLFGTNNTYNIYNLFFKNMHHPKEQFIRTEFEKMKRAFIERYNLKA